MAVKSKKILYSVAKDSDDNLVNAKNGVRGKSYFCPVCNSNLILRKSENIGRNSKRPHFAHKSLIKNCTSETVLHYVFKTLTFKKIYDLLENKEALYFQWSCKICTEIHKGNLLKKISSIKLEYNLEKCQPDIALFDAEGNVFAVIEVIVTHKPEKKVVKYYKDNNIVLIQYELTSDLDLIKIEEKLSSPDSVSICYNKKCKQCGNYLTNLYIYINSSKCYRCGYELKYTYIMNQTGWVSRGLCSHLYPEDFTNEEVNYARSKGVVLKKRHSKTAEYSYLANTCKNCNAFIGNHYMFIDYISQQKYDDTEKNKQFIGYECDKCSDPSNL